MEAFFRTHTYLVEHTNAPVRRQLMDEINWDDRMIGIKGTRGVGKTTFLLQYAKEHFAPNDRRCLYVNINNFYFQGRGIADFAGEFYKNGGKVLLIDQVFKEPNWSKELRICHDKYPELKIVFTGSSVMRLKEDNPELNGIVKSYNLRGFSFREFLNLTAGTNFKPYKLDDILKEHEHITRQILPEISPNKYFPLYLHHGFYPFFLENRNFSENLLKTMNMMTEVDILLIKQIELKYLTKIKKLFYLLAVDGPKAPNVRSDDAQLEPDVRNLPDKGGATGHHGNVLRQLDVERPHRKPRQQGKQLHHRRQQEVQDLRRHGRRQDTHEPRHRVRPLQHGNRQGQPDTAVAFRIFILNNIYTNINVLTRWLKKKSLSLVMVMKQPLT